MLNKWCCGRRLRRSSWAAVFFLLAAWGIPTARAGVPDWLRAAASTPEPPHPADANAVVLLSERVTSISPSGEITTRHREALKILRPQGRDRGIVAVYFDHETRLTYLKAWCLPANGKDYEVKEKDALETSFEGGGLLYQDTRFKLLKIPAADPGNIIGYEYVQERRPYIRQDIWTFQDDIPVARARFELQLPAGWEFAPFWLNHASVQAQSLGNNAWAWDLKDLPAVEPEPDMPDWRAVAGRMAVTYFSRQGSAPGAAQASWADIGRWFQHLAAGRRQVTPEIRQKVAELTASAPTPLAKMAALAHFVQQNVRYVAIEIGIGGYQPHPAQQVLDGRYGDCKDKATLLSAMLHVIGVDSYYVLINTDRGVVAPQVPTALTFDHVILAIRLPADVPTTDLFALRDDPQLGHLLFFDPTDPYVPLGYLPDILQQNYGLLVSGQGGELVKLPLLAPPLNRLMRVATLRLTAAGTLAGTVEEVRWGAPGSERRAQLLRVPEAQRQQALERFLGNFLGGLALHGSRVQNLQNFDKNLVLDYGFVAQNYAQRAGNLLLLRPRVLGEKVTDLTDPRGKPRQYPVEFSSTTLETDSFNITLPAGYGVMELPPPVDLESPFGVYRSKATVDGNVLHYQRSFEIKEVMVPAARVKDLKAFFAKIESDERSTAVLQQVPSSGAPAASSR